MRRDLRHAALLALAVAALVLAFAWRVAVDPAGHTLGGNDFASIAWGLWRVARALPGLPSVQVDDVLFPQGAALQVADLPEALLLAPVTLAFGPVVATNLLQVAHPALAAGLAFLLFRRLEAPPAGATTGALVFALSPVMLTGIHNGNPDATPLYLLPLVGLLARGEGWKRAVATGAVAGLAAWCNPYVGVMAVTVAAATFQRWRQVPLAALVLVVVGGAYAWTAARALAGPGAMVVKTGGGEGSAGLLGFLWPQRHWDPSGEAVHAWFVGLLPLAVAAVGAVRSPRRPRWLVLLALGLWLAMGGTWRWEPGPDMGAVFRLPGLSSLHITYRFAALVALAVGALAARATPRPWAWLFVPLVAGELLWAGRGLLATHQPPLDGGCALLADLPPGPVVDFPGTFDERWLLAQACHRRPVAQGINRPWLPPIGRALSSPDPLPALRARGFRYLVVHEATPQAARLVAAGTVVAHDDTVSVIDLEAR